MQIGLSETYLGSTIPQYLLFFGVVVVGAVVGRSLGFLYRQRIRRKVEATETEIDDIIVRSLNGPVVLLGVVLAAAFGREILTPVEPLRSVLEGSVEIPVVVAVAWMAVRLTDGLVKTYVMEYAEHTESKLDDELVPIVSRVTNIAIVSIAGVVILDSFGYDVTAVVASLGVGGIAVAFASRKTMADIFGGAHILATKPFLVDDVVEIGDTAGTVEEIGLRTTRVRDFDGRLVTIPNSTIADSEVKNISEEPAKRIRTSVELAYDTTAAETETAVALAEETINAVDGIDPEQTEVLFWDYGDRGITIRLDYRVTARERWTSIKDEVNRAVQAAFHEEGLEMAVPTDRIRLEHGQGDSPAAGREEDAA